MEEHPQQTDKPKKRQVKGSRREQAKKLRVMSHQPGPDCHCTRLKCFEVVALEERERLIHGFNTDYTSKDEQDAYLSGKLKLVLACGLLTLSLHEADISAPYLNLCI